jgi:hypothetical protein
MYWPASSPSNIKFPKLSVKPERLMLESFPNRLTVAMGNASFVEVEKILPEILLFCAWAVNENRADAFSAKANFSRVFLLMFAN